MNTQARRHSRHLAPTRAPIAAALTASSSPALPLALRFPPALSEKGDDGETPETFAADAATIARVLPAVLPLLTLDGPTLLAHLASLDAWDRAILSDDVEAFHHAAAFLDRVSWPLHCRVDTLGAYLDVEAGALRPDPLAYDAVNMNPDGSRRWVLGAAAQAWGERGEHDPYRLTIAGKPGRYWPEVAEGEAFAPMRASFEGAEGWAVPVGPDPCRPARWGFVPDARAVGAPELASVEG